IEDGASPAPPATRVDRDLANGQLEAEAIGAGERRAVRGVVTFIENAVDPNTEGSVLPHPKPRSPRRSPPRCRAGVGSREGTAECFGSCASARSHHASPDDPQRLSAWARSRGGMLSR